ncbi:MAG: WYL domain-containing protein [Actinobacteria bacterium]|nr:WYL domain-containing protein [Actinomycetota bacterium]
MSELTAVDRLRRLLAIIPWVAAEGGMSLEDVARRFDYPREDLLEDVWYVVQMIGVAPFGPADMLEARVEDDWVHIEYSNWFARPMTLRPEEVLRLLAAGQSVAEFYVGDDLGPLGRALTKLSAMVEPEVRDAVDVHLGVADEDLLEALQQAAAERRIVEIDYYSYGRDQLTTRIVEPHGLTADIGNWYLSAHCRLADGPRVFRLDRISRYEVGDETYPGPTVPTAGPEGFLRDGDYPEVELLLDANLRWVISQYPHREMEEQADGRLRIRLAVASTAWLERLLLRLGASATLQEAPEGMGEELRTTAASRVLTRYGC